MAIYTKKDGTALEIPDDVPEARRRQILNEEGIVGRAEQRNADVNKKRLSPEQQEVQRRVEGFRKREAESPLNSGFFNTSSDLNRATTHGLMGSFSDELAGALRAPVGAIQGALHGENPLTAGAKEYRIARDTARELDRQGQKRSPTASAVGEVAGALIQPGGVVRGTAARVLPEAAVAVGRRAAARAAASKAGQYAARSPVAHAIALGAGQGALNAAGESEADTVGGVLGDAAKGSVLGAGAGAAFGGAARVGQVGLDFLRSGNPKRVEEAAYNAIGGMMDRIGPEGRRVARRQAEEAARQAGGEVISGVEAAQQVETRLGRAAKQGVDEVVGDVSPGLRGLTGAIARNTGTDVSNDLGAMAERRLEGRSERFMGQMKGITGDADAVARRVGLQQERKAAGARDYNDSVMKKPFVWNDRLEDITVGKNASDDIKSGLRSAAHTIRNTYDENGKLMDPTALGWKFNDAGDVVYMKVPNMESFDLLKRGFDKDIGAALAAGDKDGARRISTGLNLLKKHLGEANPEYMTALANQRDLFQKQDALEKGQSLIRNLQGNRPGSGAREILDELKNLPKHAQDDYRLGVVDALTRLDSKQNPLATWSNLTRSPDQSKVMEWVFGDKAELQRFNRWVRRERNSAATDVAANTKAGSVTANALLAADAIEPNSNPLFGAFSGYAFGRTAGGVAGFARAMAKKLSKRTDDVQEIMGRILMSKGTVGGEKVSEGIRRTGRRVQQREAFRRKVLGGVGKGGQQTLSGYAATKQDEDY